MTELIAAHLEQSWDATPATSNHTMDADMLTRQDVRLWAVCDKDAVLGCGGLKDLGGGLVEVKSVHVAADARRRGVAVALMGHLINVVRDENAEALVLETGTMQSYAAARALYERLGFEYCGVIPGYELDPNSAFMRLDLSRTTKPPA
ncbi:MAG: GNAT family N-acetyltransferase [Sedimentitalea sp.]